MERSLQSIVIDGWWRAVDIENVAEGGGGGGRLRSGGERNLRSFLSLRVESSHERAAIYSGQDLVSELLCANQNNKKMILFIVVLPSLSLSDLQQ